MSAQRNLPPGGPTVNLDDGSIRHGDIRYVLIRADGLMGAFINDADGSRLQGLAESVFQHGGDSLARYFSDNGGDVEETLKGLEARSAQMGWGKWSITRGDGKRLWLKVDNSPFAATCFARPSCAPITGMFRAVAELALGAKVQVRETGCRSCGAPHCEFQASVNDV